MDWPKTDRPKTVLAVPDPLAPDLPPPDRPQFRSFFPLPPPFSLFLSLGVFSLNFFESRDPQRGTTTKIHGDENTDCSGEVNPGTAPAPPLRLTFFVGGVGEGFKNTTLLSSKHRLPKAGDVWLEGQLKVRRWRFRVWVFWCFFVWVVWVVPTTTNQHDTTEREGTAGSPAGWSCGVRRRSMAQKKKT